ncbi:transglycosylase SLT domain-containing protein [Spongisporangium articulatum]|uniref:Transglycosylase SLT domain-containing protein n=1 Tax=Spongisporangium articulatum TaxID=3362603 RepID=A0ABW8AI86_9ACTN
MTDTGFAAVQSRVAQLQALLSPTGTSSASNSSSAFDKALAAAGATDGTDVRQQAIDIAKKYLGVPYKWGGTDPRTGLDCSGFAQLVMKQVGVNLPRTSAEQAKVGTEVSSLDDAQPGDLVFFGSPVHHVGIYVGDGKMIDAPHTGSEVRIEKVWGTPSHIRRVLPESTGTATASSAASVSGLLGTQSVGSAGGTGALSGTPYADLFARAGRKYGVDPSLLSAIAKAESSYNPSAVSHAGARGLMQLMPGTARGLGVDPDNPTQAVNGAAKLMADNLRTFNGRVDLALAAYNAGPGAVRKYNGIPPYEETQNYVKRVSSYWKDLR